MTNPRLRPPAVPPVTSAPSSQPALPPSWPSDVPPWPGGLSGATPPGRRLDRRRPLVVAGLAAAVVVVAGGITAGVVSTGGGEHPAAQGALKAQTQVTASPSLSSAAAVSAARPQRQHRGQHNGKGTPSASASAAGPAASRPKASPAARATKRGSGLRPASLTGTWTGSYFCRQGQTGLRLTLKATSSGGLTATFSFYPTSTNVSVPSGSFVLTGSYTAKGFQLTPDHWISKPQNYSMVGMTGAANKSDTALSGSIDSPGCTTFSASR